MATRNVRKPRKIWETAETRAELLPYLGNSRQLAFVLLKNTTHTIITGYRCSAYVKSPTCIVNVIYSRQDANVSEDVKLEECL